jgi:hypothetical protein
VNVLDYFFDGPASFWKSRDFSEVLFPAEFPVIALVPGRITVLKVSQSGVMEAAEFRGRVSRSFTERAPISHVIYQRQVFALKGHERPFLALIGRLQLRYASGYFRIRRATRANAYAPSTMTADANI